jgi:hypothetical protein
MASYASTGKTGAASCHRGRHHRHAIVVLMAGKKKIRTWDDGRARDARMRERKKAGYMLACNQLLPPFGNIRCFSFVNGMYQQIYTLKDV